MPRPQRKPTIWATSARRPLFEEIVLDEEGHKGWLELQLDLIERLGEKTYSAKLVSIGEEPEGDD